MVPKIHCNNFKRVKYSNVAYLIIFEFLRPALKLDFLFCSLHVAYRSNFLKKKFGELTGEIPED